MIDLLLVILLALILASVLIGMGRKGPGIAAGFIFFFTLFLLFGWAATLWIEPTGRPVYGVYWTGPVVATILLALILLAVIPPYEPRGAVEEEIRMKSETPEETRTRHAIEIGIGGFFWLAVIGLGLIILIKSV